MDLDMLLAEADPALNRTLPGPESPEGIRLYQRIVAQAAPARAARAPRRRAAVTVFAAGAAAAALAVAVVLTAAPPGRAPGTPTASGQPRGHAAPLELAAETAARQSTDGAPGPGQYLYSELLLSSNTPDSAIPVGTVSARTWLSYDGKGRFREHICDHGCREVDGPIDATSTPFSVWGFPLVSPQSVASLPTSPAGLLTVLTHYATEEFPSYQGNLGIVEDAGSFLAAAAPPAVRAGLYRAISELPGIENLGQVKDRLGRTGEAVGITEFGLREEIVYDPATSAVLAEETVVDRPGGVLIGPCTTRGCTGVHRADGAVISSVVYAATALVDSPTMTPDG